MMVVDFYFVTRGLVYRSSYSYGNLLEIGPLERSYVLTGQISFSKSNDANAISNWLKSVV